MKLSIIIPAYNEEKSIAQIIAKLQSVDWQPHEIELIVVDDGSTDGTPRILSEYGSSIKVIRQKNQGKGAAVRAGFAQASGDYLVVQDADLEYDPEDIRQMLELAVKDSLKVIYGSRRLGRAKKKNERAGAFFYLGGVFLSWLTNILYGTRITDEATCYKMVRKDVLSTFDLEACGFEFCPEITSKIARQGIAIPEISISYHPRSISEGKKIKWRDGLIAIATLLRYRFDRQGLRSLIKNNSRWLIILAAFILVRAILFAAFWQASLERGNWENFFSYAQPAHAALQGAWHELCDWHPPFYYAFVTAVIKLGGGVIAVMALQLLLDFISIIAIDKILKLFFNSKIVFWTLLLAAIEPYWAWNNLLLISENLYIPLLLWAIYFLFKFIKNLRTGDLIWMSALLGLCALTRLNLAAIAPLFYLAAASAYWPLLSDRRPKVKELARQIVIGVGVLLLIILPWAARNKAVYNNFTLGNMVYTNTYFYNLPPLLAWQQKTSYAPAYQHIIAQAQQDLGKNVGDQGDCSQFTRAEFSRQLAYFSGSSKKYIFDNIIAYGYIHVVKMVPFFLQSGYADMMEAFGANFNKPDFSQSAISGQWRVIGDFFGSLDWRVAVYFLGTAFWGFCSLAMVSLGFYFLKRKNRKALFFLGGLILSLASAFLISPFVLARYRLPFNVFFLAAFVYAVSIIHDGLRTRKDLRRLIKRLPFLAVPAKFYIDWSHERKLAKRINGIDRSRPLPPESIKRQISFGHEPTIRCNLSCKMCFQKEGRGLRQSELDTPAVLEMYQGMIGSAEEIKLVGGEPLVYPGIFDLMGFWDGQGIPIILQSNCTLVNEANIGKLAGVKNLKAVLTSLDGPKEIHDAIRGVSGSFERLKKAIALIKRERPDVEISAFATLLLDYNYNDLFKLVRTAKDIGLTSLNILFEQVYSPQEVEATKFILNCEFGWEAGRDYNLNTQVKDKPFDDSVNAKKLKRRLRLVRLYGLLLGCPVTLVPLDYYRHLDQYLGRKPCSAYCMKLLDSELRINQNGEVIWCDVIEKSLGNLTQQTPEEIRNSPDYLKLRDFLHRQPLPVCYRCCKAHYHLN